MKKTGPLVNGAWWLIITVIIMVSFFSGKFLKRSLVHEDQCGVGKKGQGQCLHTLIWHGVLGGGGGGGRKEISCT